MFAEAFTGIEHFTLGGEVRSDFKDIDMDLKSDLDEQVKASLKRQWDARVAAFEQKIRDRLEAKNKKCVAELKANWHSLIRKRSNWKTSLNKAKNC